jgi:hypothetical protein
VVGGRASENIIWYCGRSSTVEPYVARLGDMGVNPRNVANKRACSGCGGGKGSLKVSNTYSCQILLI